MSAEGKDLIVFEQLVERGCGMDVHKETVVATIQGNGIRTVTRSFSTFTNSLKKLKAWLGKHKVTHIAMESTGVYWKPIFNIFGEDFQILLVNAQHVKNIPGHKTDKRDSRWLAKLLLAGLLKGSFIPDKFIRELRDLTRYRRKLIGQISAEKNRFQKILEDTNIKLSSVLSDVFGTTGKKMIDEILKGDYNPTELLHMVHGHVKADRQEIKEALIGHVDDHHRFMLKTIQSNIERIEQTVSEIGERIAESVQGCEETLEFLETIPGVGRGAAIGIIAEIGLNMDKFPSHNHIASWAGICPGSNESAGKNKSGRITKGNKYLRTLLVEIGWSASRTKNTYLSSKYKNLAGRRGKKRAIIAIGHKILIAAYAIIKNREAFKELGTDYLLKSAKRYCNDN